MEAHLLCQGAILGFLHLWHSHEDFWANRQEFALDQIGEEKKADCESFQSQLRAVDCHKTNLFQSASLFRVLLFLLHTHLHAYLALFISPTLPGRHTDTGSGRARRKLFVWKTEETQHPELLSPHMKNKKLTEAHRCRIRLIREAVKYDSRDKCVAMILLLLCWTDKRLETQISAPSQLLLCKTQSTQLD